MCLSGLIDFYHVATQMNLLKKLEFVADILIVGTRGTLH